MNKLFFIISTLFFFSISQAQTTASKVNAEKVSIMEQEGKIYVVLAVCLVVLTGIFLFLWTLERRISRIEKNIPH
jgi:bacteriorhodopsin